MPPAKQPGGGAGQNNTSSNSPGGRLVVRILLQPTKSSPIAPVMGALVQLESNLSAGLAEQKPLRIRTNFNGYAFAALTVGPYALSVKQPGWELSGGFNITKGRTTDFNVTVTGVTVGVTAYNIDDPDSSFMLGPWGRLAVDVPKELVVRFNQTVFFLATSYGGTIQLGSLVLPYVNSTGSSSGQANATVTAEATAVVVGDYPFSSGQWVTLQPLDTMPISQFYQTDLLVYQPSYRIVLEAP